MNYLQAIDYILDIPKFTKKNKPCHTKEALHRLGDPHKKITVIHVAGTNGKGSVCAYIASILKTAGFHTGLFISPHLVCMNERFQLDGHQVSPEVFLGAFEKVYGMSKDMEKEGMPHPTFFEFLFLMGMVIFEQEHVDYAVIETGLGGRLDATNVIEAPLISIITSISLDHTEILGDTIEKVAFEKAGIIKKKVPVVYVGKEKRVVEVIERQAKECSTQAVKLESKKYKILKNQKNGIDFLYNSSYDGTITVSIPYIARYQVENASLALLALETIKQLEGQELLKQRCTCDILREGVKHVRFEGRMESILPGVIVDGAHNKDGIKQFIQTAKQFEEKEQLTLLFSAVIEKDYNEMIKSIASQINWSRIIVTQIGGNRVVEAGTLASIFREFSKAQVIEIKSVEEAFTYAVEVKGEGMLFCVGSLYLVGEIKEYLRR